MDEKDAAVKYILNYIRERAKSRRSCDALLLEILADDIEAEYILGFPSAITSEG
jgi:hypothetical protein